MHDSLYRVDNALSTHYYEGEDGAQQQTVDTNKNDSRRSRI